MSATLAGHGLEKEQRVGDAPAGSGVEKDVTLVLGRDLVWIAIPFKNARFKAMHGLNEGDFDVQAGAENASDRLAEFGDQGLFAFVDHEQRILGKA